MCIFDLIERLFADVKPGWTNAATIVGAILGVSISIYAIYFSKKLSKESNEIIEALKKVLSSVQNQISKTDKHAKNLRLDNIRNLYELSRDDDERNNYWDYRWRFETYDNISIQIYEEKEASEIILGHCYLEILGFSNPPDHLGFENRNPEFYKVRAYDITPSGGQTLPLQEDQILACFNQGKRSIISTGTDSWTMEPKYTFRIVGIGRPKSASGDLRAEEATVYPRIKDS